MSGFPPEFTIMKMGAGMAKKQALKNVGGSRNLKVAPLTPRICRGGYQIPPVTEWLLKNVIPRQTGMTI